MNRPPPSDAAANADARLTDAYREWRQWTETEGEAIRAGDWARVAACQDAKRRLQPRILALRAAAQRGWADAGAAQARALQSVVGELIALEEQNRDWLAARHRAFLDRRAELDRSRSNLRRLRHSYAPARGAAWSSLS